MGLDTNLTNMPNADFTILPLGLVGVVCAFSVLKFRMTLGGIFLPCILAVQYEWSGVIGYSLTARYELKESDCRHFHLRLSALLPYISLLPL
jgi:hypothetical protein